MEPDQKLQEFIRQKSFENERRNKFSIGIIFWRDIWTDLTKDNQILFHYYPQLKPNNLTHDQHLFEIFKTTFPYNPCVRLLKEHDFLGKFPRESVESLYEFYRTWDEPEKEFTDKELQNALRTLYQAAENLSQTILNKTVTEAGYCKVYPTSSQIRGPIPNHIKIEAVMLNEEARKFVPIYKEFIKLCIKKLGSL